jgi:predicted phosphoribosyltransferase
MEREADRVVCALTPDPFRAVGLWYEDFSRPEDAEVRELIGLAAKQHPASPCDS